MIIQLRNVVDLTRLEQKSGKKQSCLKYFNILKVTDTLRCCGMWMKEIELFQEF